MSHAGLSESRMAEAPAIPNIGADNGYEAERRSRAREKSARRRAREAAGDDVDEAEGERAATRAAAACDKLLARLQKEHPGRDRDAPAVRSSTMPVHALEALTARRFPMPEVSSYLGARIRPF
jgi:hypothetical protein